MPNNPGKPPTARALTATGPIVGGDGKPLGVLPSDGVGLKPDGSMTPTLVPSVILTPQRTADGLSGKARALALIAELHEIRARAGSMAYRVGAILHELSTPEMVAELECSSFDVVLRDYDLVPRFDAYRTMAIAETFTEEEAATLGEKKSLALIRYAKVTGEKAPAVTILRNDLKISGTRLSDHTLESLQAAIDRVRTRAQEREEAESDTAPKVDRAVRKLGPKFRSHGAPTARFSRRRRGAKFVVRVELDADEALALFDALFGPGSR